MLRSCRSVLRAPCFILAALCLLAVTPPTFAQPDPEAPRVPSAPLPREELDRREALTLYARGLLLQGSHRLVNALNALERARKLDANSAAVHRALAPLYLALDRDDDALEAYRKAVALDPADADTVYAHARLLKRLEHNDEARTAFAQALSGPALKSRPELRLQALLELVNLHEAARDSTHAIAALRQAAELLEKPELLLDTGAYERDELVTQTADVYEHLGRACVAAKDWPGASAAFQQAREKDPSRRLRLAYNLSEVYLAQNDPAKALSTIEFYLRSKPEGTEGYERLIQVLKQAGREQEVPATLQGYAQNDGKNLALQVLLARMLVEREQLPQAEDLLRQLMQASPTPEVYKVWYLLARRQGSNGVELVLRRLDETLARAADKDETHKGDPEAAGRARAMLAALRDDPELVRGLLTAARTRLATHGLDFMTRNALAEMAGRTRNLEAAEELYRSCLRDPSFLRRGREYEVYSGLLRVLGQARKYPAVVEVCRQGLKQAQETNRVLFHTDLALALAALGKGDEAVQEAESGVNFAGDTERFYCHRTRALVLAQAGRYDAAVAACQAMFQQFKAPEQVRSTRYLLASVHSLSKNFAKAEEQLQFILETDPDEPTANNDLGYYWANEGKNLEQAETLIRKAIALDRKERTSGTSVSLDSDRDNAAFVDSLGWVLFRRGKLKEARQELERAAILPDGLEDPSIWDHLGDVCNRQGDRARAAEAWHKAVELYEKGLRPFDDHSRDIRQKMKLLGIN